MSLRRAIVCLRAAGLVVLAAAVLCGCSTPAIDASRHRFYSGQFTKADELLTDAEVPEKDRVLLLMERGMVRQAEGEYEESSQDFIEASDLIYQLQTYSISKGASSLVVNDGVQDFRGTPFERTLLHGFTAINHLSVANWDNAAVEARRIIKSLSPSEKGDYPEDAFSRYMAGFCLEMIDDRSNAALQYRKANDLASWLTIDPDSGLVALKPDTNSPSATWPAPDPAEGNAELVCFVFVGRSPRGNDVWNENWRPGMPMYAEIVHEGNVLGRSYNLADTMDLAYRTAQMEAARKVAKTVGRVVIKEVLAQAAESSTDNEAVGELVRFILIGLLEQPDLRRWETLPRWLQVARVPCPEGIDEYDVIFRNSAGVAMRTVHVSAPITRRGRTYFSFCRDLPSLPANTRPLSAGN